MAKSRKKAPAAPLEKDPTAFAFVLELVLTHGNASEAGRNIGWTADKARKFIAEFPELRELAAQAVGRFAAHELTEWQDMHAEARRKMGELMRGADEDRVKLAAAQYIVERVEGKVAQPIRDDTPQIPMESVTIRFVSSLIIYKRMSLAQAYAYAEQHPEEVKEWGRSKNLISDEKPN